MMSWFKSSGQGSEILARVIEATGNQEGEEFLHK